MTATVKGAKSVGPRLSPTATDVMTINFTEDGLTAFGRVWYRGETVSVERGSADWEMTLDGEGYSWMDLDEDAQIDKWGVRMFRPGKWSGKSYDLDEEHLTDEDREVLAKVTTEPVLPDGTPVAATATPRTRGSKRRPTPPSLSLGN